MGSPAQGSTQCGGAPPINALKPAQSGEGRHEMARSQLIEERVVMHIEHPLLEYLCNGRQRRRVAV